MTVALPYPGVPSAADGAERYPAAVSRPTVTGVLPELVGAGLEVPLATGGSVRHVNLDAAASTPAMRRVAEAVTEVLPWYASVHRGAGFLSQVSTRLYEAARAAVHDFVGARPDDVVVFVRNTTEALNVAAHCLRLPEGACVLTTAVEHHADMLPWRRAGPVVHLPPPASPAALLEAAEAALRSRRVGLVAVTGASNVTGEVFPVTELADLAHAHGVPICVDGAQLVPHRRVDMAIQGIDILALSGHKMYAPFGAGALVAPSALLRDAEPLLQGGGAVSLVTLDEVVWTDLPDRHEAGSPNVIGAVALGAAALELERAGMDAVAAHERDLLDHALARLAAVPGLRRHLLWDGPGVDRVGAITFTVDGLHHSLLAAALSAEWGVGVRHGCFCAHPYVVHLLGVPAGEMSLTMARLRRGEHPSMPGAVRASFGIGTSRADVDRLADGLLALTGEGPRCGYELNPRTGDYEVVDDPRRYGVAGPFADLDTAPHGPGCGAF